MESEVQRLTKSEKEQLKKKLITAYKRMSKNKELQKELVILAEGSAKDISKKLAKDE